MAATDGEITVRVVFFSVLKERLGRSEVVLTVPEGSTAGDVFDRLAAAYPVVEPYRHVVRLAVNASYANAAAPVKGSDEVAIITPVSGG